MPKIVAVTKNTFSGFIFFFLLINTIIIPVTIAVPKKRTQNKILLFKPHVDSLINLVYKFIPVIVRNIKYNIPPIISFFLDFTFIKLFPFIFPPLFDKILF
jgi:hypothetical protein